MSALLFALALITAYGAFTAWRSLSDELAYKDPRRPRVVAMHIVGITACVAVSLVAVLLAIDARGIVIAFAVVAAVLSGFAWHFHIARKDTEPLLFPRWDRF